ncbi:LysE family translocator [Paludibacterium denitrificans]|uniref:LysE family translocator n=1 Tax=Paludibacterium denitrificans TaxID=2675226 RepID=UPI001E467158|nr:LysE family transporter [Paludibacterium denitrificans]
MKYAGAAYLIYLGIRTWRAVPRPVTEVQQQDASRHTPWALFRTGFLVSMSNPKAFIFFTALFPQFMDAHLPQGPQLAALAATFFVIESSRQLVYAASAVRGWRAGSIRPVASSWSTRYPAGPSSALACCCRAFPVTDAPRLAVTVS